MNWADFKIAVAQGLVASAESVANIISGATKVGNADKLDDKHASDFVLLSDYNTRIIGGTEVIDFDTLFETKNYAFSSNAITIALNAPVVSSGFLKVTKGGGYTHHEYTSNAGIRYFRTYNGSTWGSWKNAADGGNADTVDSCHASELYKVTVKKGGTDANTLIDEGNYFLINGTNVPIAHGFLSVLYYNGSAFSPNSAWGATRCIRQIFYPYGESGTIITRYGLYKTNTTAVWEWSSWVTELNTGNSTKVVVSTTAPTDTTAVWIVP